MEIDDANTFQKNSFKHFSWTLTNSGAISVLFDLNGEIRSYTVAPDHLDYFEVKEALKFENGARIEAILNKTAPIKDYVEGNLSIKGGVVYYRHESCDLDVTNRILEMYRKGFPIKPMILFLDNLMANPSYRSVHQLYKFLRHQNMPITDDGHFLGYRRVNENWFDFRTGKFDNSIGKQVWMARNRVDDDPKNDCSHGFHVGSFNYGTTYNSGSPGHTIIVKVNPKDAVSVPTMDSNKLRVNEFLVLAEYKGPMTDPVYTAQGQPILTGVTQRSNNPHRWS